MGIIAAWNALLGVENKQFKQGFAEAREEVKKTDQTYKGFLKSLKGGLGKGSAIAQTMKLAAGGGAIAGLAYVTRELGGMGEEIGRLSDGMRDGSVSSREFAASLGTNIPILGNVIRGVMGISEAFTHEKAIMKENDAAWAKHWVTLQKDADAEREHAKAVREAIAESQAGALHRSRLADAGELGGAKEKIAAEDERTRLEAKALQEKLSKDLDAAGVGPEGLDRFDKHTEFYRKAMDDRARIINASREEEKQLWREHDQAVQKIQLDDAAETHRLVQEQDEKAAKNVRETILQGLEDEREALDEQIKENSKSDPYRAAQSAALRGGGTVQRFDPITNPMQETAKQQLTQLKNIDAHIKELRRGEDSDQYVSVSF